MQQFKLKQLGLAVGAAFAAGFAGHTLALAPAAFNSTPGDTAEVYVSGSSGQDGGVAVAMARVCVPGTLDRYADGANEAAYFCSVTTGQIPGITKTKLVVYKSSNGGSGNGVSPLQGSGTSLAFMSMATIAATPGLCTATTGIATVTVTGDTLGVPSYSRWNCSGTQTASVVPDAGMSDEEPSWFVNNTAGINSTTQNALVFGIGVTNGLYRSLQTLQGLNSTDTTADAGNDSNVTGLATIAVRDNEANMPSLSREVIASLMNGDITAWTELRGPGGQSLTPTDPIVYIARRGNTSGTQKWTQNFLYAGITDPVLSTRCYPGARAMSFNGAGANVTSAAGSTDCSSTGVNGNPANGAFDPVFQGTGSGDVRNCLAAHDTGSRWAIGLTSTESTFAQQSGWKFIKIDGASPSLLNVVTGKYKSWVEQALNTGPTLRAGDPTRTVNALFAMLGTPGNVRALNQATPQVWGYGPLLQLPTVVGSVPFNPTGQTQAFIQTNPVNILTKQGSGSLDNCSTATVWNSATDVPTK